jgi:release factor-specific protein-(glutamine-N5) methyltransferase
MKELWTQSADQLRWLLRDKYRLNESIIIDILNQKSLASLTDSLLRKKVETDIARLAEGEPLAYVIGWVKFFNCSIDLSLRPLIPRPETEFWVGELIREWNGTSTPGKVLDLCCGSGCIGIALSKNLPQVKMRFADISPSVVEQTQINAQRNQISPERFSISQSDLFSNLKNEVFDVIISNPPYVNPNGQVSPDLAWEPAQSLFAQKDGLALIEEIILQSKNHLNESGELILEFGKGQEKEIEQMAKVAGWKHYRFLPDQYGVVRWGRLKRL